MDCSFVLSWLVPFRTDDDISVWRYYLLCITVSYAILYNESIYSQNSGKTNWQTTINFLDNGHFIFTISLMVSSIKCDLGNSFPEHVFKFALITFV